MRSKNMKLFYYFTKEYREEVRYLKQKQMMKSFIKLSDNSESIDDKVKRLQKL